MAETAGERLGRLLALVPFVARRPGVRLTELAVEFGVPEAQIRADLDLIMVCGLPGYYPDDLIDVVLDEDGGTVSIAFDAGIERPVRLTADEVVALTAALQALAELPGLVDAEPIRSSLAKLEQAGAAPAGDPVRIAAPTPGVEDQVVRQAIDRGRQLWMRYYTASRDSVTERTVDPLRLLVTDGHTYLEAFCTTAQAVRHFRVDRIDAARVLDEPAQAPLWVESEVPQHMFAASESMPMVTLLLAPAARWVAEYYPTESAFETSGPAGEEGWLRVQIRSGDEEWVVRLMLSLAGSATVEDRPDLAATVRDRAAAALAAYD